MKVKKFIAGDNQEVLMKVRTEMGSDAVILHQRKVKPGGILGFLKKPFIEVVAAREDISLEKADKINRRHFESPEEILQKKVELKVKEKPAEAPLAEDISDIKKMLNAVIKKIKVDDLPGIIINSENDEILWLYNLLKEQEIEEELLEEIMKECMSAYETNAESSHSKDMLQTKFKKVINKYFIQNGCKHKTKVLFFVGPTGVGKTTTIAKLAAQYSLNEGKEVGLISADTYRIAAVEQLKTYSDILNIPLEVIYEPCEINQAINKLKDKDLILVDTAGRSHRNEKQVKELKTLLDEVPEKDIYLVVSCTSKNSDIKDIIKCYSFLNNYKIIFTKIDEATTFGLILNTVIQSKKPLSYITYGQSVPDDIEKISIDRIAGLLTGEVLK